MKTKKNSTGRVRKRRIGKEELKEEIYYKFSTINEEDRRRLIGVDKYVHMLVSIGVSSVLGLLALTLIFLGLLTKNVENRHDLILVGIIFGVVTAVFFIISFASYFKSDNQRVKRQLKNRILKSIRFENERKKVYDDTDIESVTLVKSFIKLKTFPRAAQQRFGEFKVDYAYGVSRTVTVKEDTDVYNRLLDYAAISEKNKTKGPESK